MVPIVGEPTFRKRWAIVQKRIFTVAELRPEDATDAKREAMQQLGGNLGIMVCLALDRSSPT